MIMAMTMVMEEIMEGDHTNHKVQMNDSINLADMINDMWKGLLKNWWLYTIIVSITASITYFGSLRGYKPEYSCYSTFTVTADNSSGYNEISYNMTATSVLGQVFPYVLTNNLMEALVEEELGIQGIWWDVTAEATQDTNLITLTVTAPSAQLAYDILQSVIRNYPKVSVYVTGDVTLHLLDESGIPTYPSNYLSPRRNGMTGAAAGIALSFALMLIYALTRSTVNTEDDLRGAFNIACLGTIPNVKLMLRRNTPKDQQRIAMDVRGIPQYYIESMRMIRTRVEQKCEEKGYQSILITSAVPREGKTSVAVNLALSLAHRGKSTVLMDCDMRNPSVAGLLGMPPQQFGVYEYLTGEALRDAVKCQYSRYPLLTVLPGSKHVGNTQEVLNGQKIHDLIVNLKKEYDYIIIDTPPSGIVSDAAALSRITDAGIFVVRQDFAKTELLREGMEIHSGTGIHMIGTILNNTRAGITRSRTGFGNYGYGRSSYRYGRGHYGYGYGYGYNHDSDQAAEE